MEIRSFDNAILAHITKINSKLKVRHGILQESIRHNQNIIKNYSRAVKQDCPCCYCVYSAKCKNLRKRYLKTRLEKFIDWFK